jgi:hypothetical protein
MAKSLCVLIVVLVATVVGYSQEVASQYVSPWEAVPRGKAPKMQVQFLNPGESPKQ